MGNKLNQCVRRSRKKRYRVLRKDFLTPVSEKVASSDDPINQEECFSPNEGLLSKFQDNNAVVQDADFDILLDDSALCGVERLPQTPPKGRSPTGVTLTSHEFLSPPVQLFRDNSLKTYSKREDSINPSPDEMEITVCAKNTKMHN